ncbi:MAG: sedoheptulose 7-phosphate cyclase [Thermoplasmata archaeon]|nr:sedoheptulose 7-phosphate cyclase [Candidatus Sysuiplasma acidicola]
MTGMEVDRQFSGTAGATISFNGEKISVKNRFDYSYDVFFTGASLLSTDNNLLRDMIGERKFLVVMSETVNELYGRKIREYFRRMFEGNRFGILTLPLSEHTKNIETVLRICREGNRFGLDRKSLFVAVGGGVLMDAVGMASSIYMRKLDYVRIPTTLVGQVDAGIGLKTGVDFEDRKNFIGSFHPPAGVLNDFRFLRTLDAEQIRNGLAEIGKMAIVSDAKLFSTLESNSKSLVDYYVSGKNAALTQWINITSARRMLEQLQINPYENDLERLVDFGHTFSPFIEMYTAHSIRHGLAVALDIAISTEISFILGRTDEKLRDRILAMLEDFGFRLYDPVAFDTEKMWKSLDSIVLRRGGKLNLVIPTELGKAEFLNDREELEKDVLAEALANLRQLDERGVFR